MTANTRLFQVAIVLITLIFYRAQRKNKTRLVYYNVDSLFKTQIDYLVGHQAVISKKAVLNGVEKITTIDPKDSLAWNARACDFL